MYHSIYTRLVIAHKTLMIFVYTKDNCNTKTTFISIIIRCLGVWAYYVLHIVAALNCECSTVKILYQ